MKNNFRPMLSEAPNALEGAAKWAEEELERIKRAREDTQKIKKQIAPYRREAIRKIQEKKNVAVASV